MDRKNVLGRTVRNRNPLKYRELEPNRNQNRNPHYKIKNIVCTNTINLVTFLKMLNPEYTISYSICIISIVEDICFHILRHSV